MLLIIRLSLEKLQVLGKDFPWKKPSSCLECGCLRLWGHGYVRRYFHGFTSGLWIKRYRCPECHAVHTLRHEGYSPGFQYSWATINHSIRVKTHCKTFLKLISRQCQQYWFKAHQFQKKRQENFIDSQHIPIS